MPITFEVDHACDIAWMQFTAPFTFAETVAALAEFRAAGGRECRRIYEFRDMKVALDAAKVRQCCEEMLKGTSGKPIALVAGNELAFDMCKAIARTLSPRVLARVFETRPAAEQWLQIVIARASRLAIEKVSAYGE